MTAAAVSPDPRPPLFSPRVVLWIVLVGVISFSALLALSAYAPDLRSGSDGGAHALSKSAVGFAGAVKLLKEEGIPVQVSRGSPLGIGGGSGVLVLTPTEMTRSKDVQAVRFQGVILVVLPKWEVAPRPLQPGWVDKLGLVSPQEAAGPIKDLSSKIVIERRKGTATSVFMAHADAPLIDAHAILTPGPVDSLQTISGADLTPVLLDDAGKTVLALSRKRAMFVLSDPDLLNTHGLADLRTARAAETVLDGLRNGGPVMFDVTLNGYSRGRSLLKLALEPPFLGVTICLLAAAALMGVQAAARFGPAARPRRALALGKQALADNSAALIRMARREPSMAAPYAALVRADAAKAVGAPHDLGPDQLDSLLDRLGTARGVSAPFSALVLEAHAVKTDQELMRAAARLHQWKMEMTRDRR